MRYEKYEREIKELKQTPLPLGGDWVKVPVRNAKQFIKCQERGITVYTDNVPTTMGFCRNFNYICVKFDDIVNLFDKLR